MNEIFIEEICDKLAKAEINEEHALKMLEHSFSQFSQAPNPNLALPTPIYKEKFTYNEPCLRDHLIFDEQVLLGVTHCSIAIEAFKKIYPAIKLYGLQQFAFFEPIFFSEDDEAEITVTIHNDGLNYNFEINYNTNKSGLSGLVAKGNYVIENRLLGSGIDIDQFTSSPINILTTEQIYKPTKAVVHLDSLHTLQQVYVSSQGNLGNLSLTDEIKHSTRAYFLHPALIDGACTCSFMGNPQLETESYVPFFIKEITLSDFAVTTSCYCHAKITKITNDMVISDMKFCHKNGQVLASITGFTFKKIDKNNFFKNKLIKADLQETALNMNVTLKSQGNSFMSNTTSSLIKTYLLTKLAKLLSIELNQIDAQLNFIELGLDSVQLMSLARDIEAEVNIELYPTLFFEYENVEALINYFISEHKNQFDNYLQNNSINIQTEPEVGQAINANPVITTYNNEAVGPVLSVSQTDIDHSVAASNQIPKENIYLSNHSQEEQLHDIAVVGMAGMFPKSENIGEFSDHLLNGTDLVDEIPLSHWDYKPWFDSNEKLTTNIYCKWGGFIAEVDKFDADFFNISEQEAQLMDPQIRLLLQVLYATADDAGYSNVVRGSNTGVFVGSSFQDYAYCLFDANISSQAYGVVGNANAMVANRASFYFNLRGPSLTVDTACSSSLVALHLACQALKNRECDAAFVAGVNLILSPRHYSMFCSIGALSASGRCHTFDEAADGYIPSEAIAGVLLKPLTKALADGDRIYAVIKGSAVAHGGHASAITAPSVNRETEVILKAWADAKVDPRTISYMEAHGTGTKLGDPVEMEAVKKAFAKHTTDTGFCAIGSLKAHMGHAEAAAGIASLIKVILGLKAKRIPAMPNFNILNPYISLEKSPVYINKEVEDWANLGNHPRRAGINSFGFGGTYVHTVIEDFPENDFSNHHISYQPNLMHKLVLLSAQHEEALRSQAFNLKNYLSNTITASNSEHETNALLKSIAYTLQVGRESMEHRAAFIIDSVDDLAKKLERFIEQNIEADDILVGKPSQEKLNLVLSGKAGEVYLATLLQEQDISALARLWVLGAQIDWSLLYNQQTRPNKVSLPTYPFIKKRYWYEPKVQTAESLSGGFLNEKYGDLIQQYSENARISAEDFVTNSMESGLNFFDPTLGKPKKVDEKSIKKWLYKELKTLTQLDNKQIDPDRLFEEFGINSIDMIALYGRLSQFLGWPIPPGAFQEARTINTLVKYAISARQGTSQDQMEKIKKLVAKSA